MTCPFVRFDDLASLGVPFTRTHVRRLVKAGVFPAPVQIGLRSIAWRREAIEAYIASRDPAGSVTAATHTAANDADSAEAGDGSVST